MDKARLAVWASTEFLGIQNDGQSIVYFPETGGWQFVFLDQVVSVDSVRKEAA